MLNPPSFVREYY